MHGFGFMENKGGNSNIFLCSFYFIIWKFYLLLISLTPLNLILKAHEAFHLKKKEKRRMAKSFFSKQRVSRTLLNVCMFFGDFPMKS